jgi:hypothetical protein
VIDWFDSLPALNVPQNVWQEIQTIIEINYTAKATAASIVAKLPEVKQNANETVNNYFSRAYKILWELKSNIDPAQIELTDIKDLALKTKTLEGEKKAEPNAPPSKSVHLKTMKMWMPLSMETIKVDTTKGTKVVHQNSEAMDVADTIIVKLTTTEEDKIMQQEVDTLSIKIEEGTRTKTC